MELPTFVFPQLCKYSIYKHDSWEIRKINIIIIRRKNEWVNELWLHFLRWKIVLEKDFYIWFKWCVRTICKRLFTSLMQKNTVHTSFSSIVYILLLFFWFCLWCCFSLMCLAKNLCFVYWKYIRICIFCNNIKS